MVTRLKALCVRTIFISLALTLFGCSSSGNDNDSVPESQVGTNEINNGGAGSSDNITSNTNPTGINVTTHTTSLVSVNYPSAWTVDTSNADIDAQFFSNERNEFGGLNNCVLSSTFAPGGSLLELTEGIIDIFASNPMPDVSFVTVNGTSMSRISGIFDGTTIDGAAQLAYEDDYIHALLCLNLAPEELSVFFDSMRIL